MHQSLDSCQVPILFGALKSLGELKALDIFSVVFWIRKEILGSYCLIQQGFSYWARKILLNCLLNRQENKQLSLFRMKKRKTFLGPLSLSSDFPPGVMNWHRKELKHHIWTSPCHVPSDDCPGLPPCILQSPSRGNWTNQGFQEGWIWALWRDPTPMSEPL